MIITPVIQRNKSVLRSPNNLTKVTQIREVWALDAMLFPQITVPFAYSLRIMSGAVDRPRVLEDWMYKNGVWKLVNSARKPKNWSASLVRVTKVISKHIKDLDVGPDTIKLLKENIEKQLFDIGLGSNFSNLIPKAQATELLGLHQTKKLLLHSTRNNNKSERQPKKWKKILANLFIG